MKETFSKTQIELYFILKGYPRVSETFIAQEIHLLESLGYKIKIISMKKAREDMLQPINKKVEAKIQYLPEDYLQNILSIVSLNFKCFTNYPWKYSLNLFSSIIKSLRRFNSSHLSHFTKAAWVTAKLKMWEKKDYTYIHSHFAHSPTEIAYYISKITDLPFSISAHAKDIYTIPKIDLLERIKAAEFITTCTEFNYQFLKNISSEISDKVYKNYHGISSDDFTPVANFRINKNSLIFISVGRLVPKKGYFVILKALNSLKKQGYNFSYDIFGSGVLEKELRSMVAELNLEEQVKFHLTVTHPQMIEHIKLNPGIFLCGSLISSDGDRDGIPNTVAEAMSMELPVIATKVSGIPEIIQDGVNGFLIESEDTTALANKIKELAEDPMEAQRVGKAGREKMKSMFESKKLITELSNLLEKSITKKFNLEKYTIKKKS